MRNSQNNVDKSWQLKNSTIFPYVCVYEDHGTFGVCQTYLFTNTLFGIGGHI